MIIGSLLLPAIGGGVCQTATTLFNNAFELGLPIVERHNHSFYISHYPLGRDATVSWGGPDFAFRNDLETGILIKTRYTDSTLTFSFYGTDPGRRVVTSTGERTNWRSPQTDLRARPVRSARLRTHGLGLEPVRLRRHCHAQGLRTREAEAPRCLHERVHRRRPDPDLRSRALDSRPVLRAATGLEESDVRAIIRARRRSLLPVADAERPARVAGRLEAVAARLAVLRRLRRRPACGRGDRRPEREEAWPVAGAAVGDRRDRRRWLRRGRRRRGPSRHRHPRTDCARSRGSRLVPRRA